MHPGAQTTRLRGRLLSRKQLYRERGSSKIIFYLMVTGRKYEIHAEGAHAELMQSARNGERITVIGYMKRQGWQPAAPTIIAAIDIVFE